MQIPPFSFLVRNSLKCYPDTQETCTVVVIMNVDPATVTLFFNKSQIKFLHFEMFVNHVFLNIILLLYSTGWKDLHCFKLNNTDFKVHIIYPGGKVPYFKASCIIES